MWVARAETRAAHYTLWVASGHHSLAGRGLFMADWKVITGNCLEVLPALAPGSVDAVVTDPPYGIGFAEWDTSIPDLKWLADARRIARTVVITPRTGQMWKWPEPDWVLCWHRPGSTQRTTTGRFSHWEPVLVYGDNPYWVDARTFLADTQTVGIDHPCPKPIPVMRWLVEGSSEWKTILDPFCGSGTTGVACVQTSRNFIGIEIDPGYAEIARRRIAEAANTLWTPTVKQQEQSEMFA